MTTIASLKSKLISNLKVALIFFIYLLFIILLLFIFIIYINKNLLKKIYKQ